MIIFLEWESQYYAVRSIIILSHRALVEHESYTRKSPGALRSYSCWSMGYAERSVRFFLD